MKAGPSTSWGAAALSATAAPMVSFVVVAALLPVLGRGSSSLVVAPIVGLVVSSLVAAGASGRTLRGIALGLSAGAVVTAALALFSLSGPWLR